MKSVLFARVSSREQEETGFSLESQKKLLSEYAFNKGYSISKLYSISESASGKKERDEFYSMVEYLRKHNIKILIVEKTDRLTRNIRDAVVMNDWINEDPEREIHFVKESSVISQNSQSHQKFIWNIKVSVSQFYTDNLSEEVRKGQREKAEQGYYPYAPPIGYISKIEGKRKIPVEDPVMWPLLRDVFIKFSQSQISGRRLTEYAKDIGLRNSKGNPISKSRMYEILRMDFYRGYFYYKEKLMKGNHKPLVSEDIWNAVQDVLNGNTAPKVQKHKYCFKGLVKCSECGYTIRWEKQKGKYYGHCKNYENCNDRKSIRKDKSENKISKVLEQVSLKDPVILDLVREELKSRFKLNEQVNDATLESNQKDVQKLKKRLNVIYDDRLDGRISVEEYDRRSKEYSNQIVELEEKLKNTNKNSFNFADKGIEFYDLTQNAHKIFKTLDEEKKRHMLQILFKSIKKNDRKVDLELTKPFQLIYEAKMNIKSSTLQKINKISQEKVELSESKSNRIIASLDGYITKIYRGQESNLQAHKSTGS